MGGHLYSPDAEIMFRTTESIAEKGTTAIEPLQGFATREGKDGKEYGQYGLAQPVLAVPFYLVGKVISHQAKPELIFSFRSNTIQYHDLSLDSWAKRLAVSRYNQIVSALIAIVVFLCAKELFRSERTAILCALLYGTCTMAWPQSKTFFSEPTAAFFLLTGFYLLCGRPRYLLSGVCLGLALLTRTDSIVAFPALGLFALYRYPKRISIENLKRILLFMLPIILAGCVIAGYNAYRFGSPFDTGYEDQEEGIKFSTPLLVGLYGLLLSPGKGLFIYSPILLLLFSAVPRFLRERRDECLALLGVCAGYLIMMAKWQNWAGGWCWGPRHIFQIHCFLILPIGVLIRSAGSMGHSRESGNLKADVSIPDSLQRYGRIFGWVTLVLVSLLIQVLGSSASFMDAMLNLSELERHFTIWKPELILPVLHAKLIHAGRTDIWWSHFLRAPLGGWRLLALLPPTGIAIFGLALFRRFRDSTQGQPGSTEGEST